MSHYANPAFPMPDRQSAWVRSTLAGLSHEQKIGQMLHPNIRPHQTVEEIAAHLPEGVDIGGAFLFTGSGADYQRVTAFLQNRAGIPLLLSSDLESGAGRMIKDATLFPDLISLAAAAEAPGAPAELALTMGEATAVEGRAHGVHWTFGPVVDVNANPYNPITNTRSLGDRPDTIGRLACQLIQGMQSHGMVACAKHFPGDGWDDRDQHICTTINPLSMEQWFASSGRMFSEAIAAGVWSVMIGHIALPAWDAGDPADPLGAPPATLSHKLLTDLLRGKLGFDGLIISDALEMGGLVSRVGSIEELVIGTVNAGCDMLLFCDGKRDYQILFEAARTGQVGMDRIDDAVSRILAVKEVLGFAANPASAQSSGSVSAADSQRFLACSTNIARHAMTLANSRPGELPLKLRKADEILVLHLRSNPEFQVDGFDALLQAEGYQVYRRTEADYADFFDFQTDYRRFKAFVVLWVQGPTYGTSSIRPGGPYMRLAWGLIRRYPDKPIIHISFGNPYLGHEIPWATTLINAYSPDGHSQQAALDLLMGRLEPRGKSPVDLGRPDRLGELLKRDLMG